MTNHHKIRKVIADFLHCSRSDVQELLRIHWGYQSFQTAEEGFSSNGIKRLAIKSWLPRIPTSNGKLGLLSNNVGINLDSRNDISSGYGNPKSGKFRNPVQLTLFIFDIVIGSGPISLFRKVSVDSIRKFRK